jgi:hypothetical protein
VPETLVEPIEQLSAPSRSARSGVCCRVMQAANSASDADLPTRSAWRRYGARGFSEAGRSDAHGRERSTTRWPGAARRACMGKRRIVAETGAETARRGDRHGLRTAR